MIAKLLLIFGVVLVRRPRWRLCKKSPSHRVLVSPIYTKNMLITFATCRALVGCLRIASRGHGMQIAFFIFFRLCVVLSHGSRGEEMAVGYFIFFCHNAIYIFFSFERYHTTILSFIVFLLDILDWASFSLFVRLGLRLIFKFFVFCLDALSKINDGLVISCFFQSRAQLLSIFP